MSLKFVLPPLVGGLALFLYLTDSAAAPAANDRPPTPDPTPGVTASTAAAVPARREHAASRPQGRWALSGRVTTTGGEALAAAWIQADLMERFPAGAKHTAAIRRLGRARSGPDGGYNLDLAALRRVEDLRGWTLVVSAWGKDHHPAPPVERPGVVTAGESSGAWRQDFTLTPGATVTGRIVDGGGRPVPGTWVRFMRMGPLPPGIEQRGHSARTDGEGVYRIGVSGGGSYDLHAVGRAGTVAVEDLAVAEGMETALPPYTLEGKMAVRARLVDPDGHPVVGARLDLAARYGPSDPNRPGLSRTVAVTDAAGWFSLSGLRPGGWKATLRTIHPHGFVGPGPSWEWGPDGPDEPLVVAWPRVVVETVDGQGNPLGDLPIRYTVYPAKTLESLGDPVERARRFATEHGGLAGGGGRILETHTLTGRVSFFLRPGSGLLLTPVAADRQGAPRAVCPPPGQHRTRVRLALIRQKDLGWVAFRPRSGGGLDPEAITYSLEPLDRRERRDAFGRLVTRFAEPRQGRSQPVRPGRYRLRIKPSPLRRGALPAPLPPAWLPLGLEVEIRPGQATPVTLDPPVGGWVVITIRGTRATDRTCAVGVEIVPLQPDRDRTRSIPGFNKHGRLWELDPKAPTGTEVRPHHPCLLNRPLPPGRYRLNVRVLGYREWTGVVRVEAGRVRRLEIMPRPD